MGARRIGNANQSCVHGAERHDDGTHIGQGGDQGDPFVGLLFPLTYHSAVRAAGRAAKAHDANARAYGDDVDLFFLPAGCADASNTFVVACARIGLTANLSKEKVWLCRSVNIIDRAGQTQSLFSQQMSPHQALKLLRTAQRSRRSTPRCILSTIGSTCRRRRDGGRINKVICFGLIQNNLLHTLNSHWLRGLVPCILSKEQTQKSPRTPLEYTQNTPEHSQSIAKHPRTSQNIEEHTQNTKNTLEHSQNTTHLREYARTHSEHIQNNAKHHQNIEEHTRSSQEDPRSCEHLQKISGTHQKI